MERIGTGDDQEVIHQLAVWSEGLGPYPSMGRHQVLGLTSGISFWRLRTKAALLQERMISWMPSSACLLANFQKPGSSSLRQSPAGQSRFFIAFAFEAQDGVGTSMDAAVDHAGKVHPKKGNSGLVPGKSGS